MTATAEFTSTADLAAEFNENGQVYVGNLQVEDTLALIKELGRSADELRIEDGFLKADELSPANRQICGATFEAIINRGERRCAFCKVPAFLHRSERDPVVIG